MINNTYIYSKKNLDSINAINAINSIKINTINNIQDMMNVAYSSNSEDDTAREKVNNILIALGVIASLKEYDLLTWDASGIPNVQVYGTFRSIRRYLKSQSRNITVYYLNKTVYDAITMFKEGDEGLCSRLKPALLNAIHGLKNLMNTYNADIQIVQAINILNQDIINLENDYIHEEAIN